MSRAHGAGVAPPGGPSASAVLEALVRHGATDLLGIPDNASGALFDLAAVDERVRLLTVTREGEAFAVASGLWMGGASPVVSVQGTGILESGDAIRGTAVRMGVPLVCLVGYRGYAKMVGAGIDPLEGLRSLSDLRRPDVDSAALHLESTLAAWDVPYLSLSPGDERTVIDAAWQRAHGEERPVAVLVTSPLR